MAGCLTLTGRLARVYKPDQPALSGYHTPPFHTDLDFDSYRLLGRTVWPASKVTYERKYELLAEIVTILRRHGKGRFAEIVFQARMPSIIRMPEALFGDDIFFVLGLDEAIGQLAAEGIAFLAVEEGFLRHALEDGQNGFRLRWYNAPEGSEAALDMIAADLVALGIVFDPARQAA